MYGAPTVSRSERIPDFFSSTLTSTGLEDEDARLRIRGDIYTGKTDSSYPITNRIDLDAVLEEIVIAKSRERTWSTESPDEICDTYLQESREILQAILKSLSQTWEGRLASLILDLEETVQSSSPSYGFFRKSCASSSVVYTVSSRVRGDIFRIALEPARDVDTLKRVVELVGMDNLAADNYVMLIQRALSLGAQVLAREYSELGRSRYPDDRELAKFARILAPPQLLAANLPSDPGIRSNSDWLNANWQAYRGKWVAVKDGVLVATADTASELKKSVGTLSNMMVTRIP